MLSTKDMLLQITPVVLQLAGLCFAVWVDPYIQKKQRRIMLAVVALCLCLIVQNIAESLLVRTASPGWRSFTAWFGYSIRPLILMMFLCIVSDRESHRIGWALVAVNAAIHLTAFFSGICFFIDAANHFHRGPLGYACHVISAFLLLELLSQTFRRFGEGRKNLWIPVVNALLIVSAAVMDTFSGNGSEPVSFLTAAVVSASLFYYIWLHLQFVREHEHALMSEQRIQIMMSQIQPHFLYNTLATIKALCRKDPEKAAVITEKFGAYLRQNLDSLGQSELVPFSKELEHTRIYTDIEMVRFDSIRVEYDIQDSGFSVPPLTLQPLVENAIRHGVRIREEGIVRILTRRTENCHEIAVQDNGAGFDVGIIGSMDDSHIGIRNVRERLEKMCGAVMTIDSRDGEGTTVTIRIPAGP